MLLHAVLHRLSAGTYVVFPAYDGIVYWSAALLYGLGEIGLIGWLLIRGARADAA